MPDNNGTLGSYAITAGTKLSYGALNQGELPSSWTDLLGCTEIPELGTAPDTDRKDSTFGAL